LLPFDGRKEKEDIVRAHLYVKSVTAVARIATSHDMSRVTHTYRNNH
jgi:hypothetical protein